MSDQIEKIYLVSDAHLGNDVYSAEKNKRESLLSFLDFVREEGDRLIILGDLFDFWFEYRSMIDVTQFPVLAGLWQIRKSGIRIDYYLGNHDYWTSGFLESEIVTNVYNSPSSDQFGSKSALLAHGDGLSSSEKGYLFMKSILRHPVSYSIFRLLHPDIGAWIARKTSETSRRGAERKRDKSSAILREFAHKKLEAGEYDWIIAGHSHQPEKISFGSGIYLNIGDWSENFTYGFIDGEEIHLKEWDR